MDSPDHYTRQAAGYKVQLDQVRVEIGRREDKIIAARESMYRNPGAREVIQGDIREWTAEIKLLEAQAVLLNKLLARTLTLQAQAQQLGYR